MNANAAEKLIADCDGDIDKLTAAIVQMGMRETIGDNSPLNVNRPSDRGEMGEPCLVDQANWRAVMGWMALITVVVAVIMVVVLIPSSTAAPMLEWLQSWLP